LSWRKLERKKSKKKEEFNKKQLEEFKKDKKMNIELKNNSKNEESAEHWKIRNYNLKNN